MRLMLLTALAVWIASNFLFVAWMRWRAGAPGPRNLREGDRINYEIEPHPSERGGESRGGFSPPRAPRTVREPLDSHGSRCSTVALA